MLVELQFALQIKHRQLKRDDAGEHFVLVILAQ